MPAPRPALGLAISLSVWAVPAVANSVTCVLQNTICVRDCAEMQVAFDIDASQFAPPLNPDDPPRRQVTMVRMDGATFAAEAIMLPGGVVGFHEDAGALGRRLMIVQPDGRARLTLQPQNEVWSGLCTLG